MTTDAAPGEREGDPASEPALPPTDPPPTAAPTAPTAPTEPAPSPDAAPASAPIPLPAAPAPAFEPAPSRVEPARGPVAAAGSEPTPEPAAAATSEPVPSPVAAPTAELAPDPQLAAEVARGPVEASASEPIPLPAAPAQAADPAAEPDLAAAEPAASELGDGRAPASEPAPKPTRTSWPAPAAARIARSEEPDEAEEPEPAGRAEAEGRGPLVPWRRSDLPVVELRRRRLIVLLCMAIATASGVLLAVAGVSMVRNSTVGRYEQALGPDEPGYQALVVPTPTMAVVHRGADGTLAGVSLLALEPGDNGGSVVVVPPSLVAQKDPGVTTTLADVYATDGAAGVTSALGRVLAVAIGDRVEVDDTDWARLVGPVGPVDFTLDNAVTGWAAGAVHLEPADVGRFLSARDPDETDLDRLERQEQFWTAWLKQVSQGGTDAVPGDVEVGVGRFVKGIAAETVLSQALPVERDDQADGLHLRPNAGQVASLIAQAVPFPTGPEAGARIRVRLLNGTDDRALTTEVATFLVGGGAEIDIVGNATSFDVPKTTVGYSSGADRQVLAGWIAGVLKTQNIEELPPAEDEIDVTVILGNDARDLIGR